MKELHSHRGAKALTASILISTKFGVAANSASPVTERVAEKITEKVTEQIPKK